MYLCRLRTYFAQSGTTLLNSKSLVEQLSAKRLSAVTSGLSLHPEDLGSAPAWLRVTPSNPVLPFQALNHPHSLLY